MRVCLDVRPAVPHFPGIGRYIRGLTRALPSELKPDEQVHLLINPWQAGDEWIQKLVLKANVITHTVACSPFSLAQQWQIPQVLRQIRPDLYHSFTAFMPFRPGVPTVLAVHDLIPLRYPRYATFRARSFFRITMSLALNVAQHVIANSETTRRDFLNQFDLPGEKIVAIPLAAGAVFRPPKRNEIEQARRKFGLPEVYVFYLGSNRPHKNLPRLIEAWAKVIRNPRLDRKKLVIAGFWDPRYPEAKLQASRLNVAQSICFLGTIPEEDLPGLYSGAELFVFPSLYEGFGFPVLEAMSCGIAVACSNTSSLQEVAGEAAVYFDPADPDEIAMTLTQVLEDNSLQESIRERGLERARQYSWQKTARQTVAVYRAVGSGKSSSASL